VLSAKQITFNVQSSRFNVRREKAVRRQKAEVKVEVEVEADAVDGG